MHPLRAIKLLLIFAIPLAGCQTLKMPSHIEPVGDNYATIHNYKHDLIYTRRSWNQFRLYSVDDKLVHSLRPHTDPEKVADFRNDDSKKATKIQAGERNLIIEASFHRGERSGPFISKIPLTFNAVQNGVYRLNGEVSGKVIKVWVENYSTAERVSKVNSGESVCTGCKVPITIFIPMSR